MYALILRIKRDSRGWKIENRWTNDLTVGPERSLENSEKRAQQKFRVRPRDRSYQGGSLPVDEHRANHSRRERESEQSFQKKIQKTDVKHDLDASNVEYLRLETQDTREEDSEEGVEGLRVKRRLIF